MKTRSTEEIIQHALQKELKLLAKAKDKAKQTSEDYINAYIKLSEATKEILAEINKKTTSPNKVAEITKRAKYFENLTKKEPDAIFNNEFRTQRGHDDLAMHITLRYGDTQ
ncbi:MAG: hypothetical protein CMH98_19065 [Oceanospirillaceae bacterium]|nr:hypothetical protein [Oceanospirillaceae bacterium]